MANVYAEYRNMDRTDAELEALRRERDEAVAARECAFDMLATFTHELRTPMTGILGMANLLLGTPLDEDQNHYARTIWDSGSHLRRLVDDVVELSMLESGGFRLEPAPVCPAEIVRGVLDIVSPEARKKKIGLSWQVDYELEGDFEVDAGRLRQLLLNLTANAIRYTDKGSVKIIASVEPGPGRETRAVFEVSDTGIGMSGEVVSGLFSRFMRAGPPDRRGAGLGLAICRQIVELMGGYIEAESTPGKGSRFLVTLPLVPAGDAKAAGDDRPVPISSEHASGLDLLVVEDDDLNQMYFETLLRAGGHRVTLAGNGKEALTTLRDRRFDAVLMDIQMPVMDGMAATRAIRELPGDRGRVPVIALSGGVDRHGGAASEGVGFTDYLTKPVDIGDLARALTRATGRPVRVPDYSVGPPDTSPLSPAAERAIDSFLDETGSLDSAVK